MNTITLAAVALGLAMDCFAVSVASGMNMKYPRLKDALRIATFFGLFQAAMPLVGWLAGRGLRDFILGFDHWIAFGLLSLIGCKMIYESTKMQSGVGGRTPLHVSVLLVLSVATSIDALAVGISLRSCELLF